MSNKPIELSDKELQAYHDVHGWELICQVRKTPTVLYGIFLEIVRQFYADPGNLPITCPKKVWTPDDKSTIWIDTINTWEDKHPEFRPAIYVEIGSLTYASLTGRKDGFIGGSRPSAELDFSRSGTGTVSYVHIAGSAGEAVALADATLDYMDAFGQVIRDDFCFNSFALTERVPLKQMPKESKERYGSVVTMSFTFQDTWTLKPEAQHLKVLSFNARQALVSNGIVQLSTPV